MIVDIENKVFYSTEDDYKKSYGLNNASMLPSHVIEIEESHYEQLMRQQSQGASLQFDANGVNAIMPQRDVGAEIKYAMNTIDSAADAARVRDQSVGQLLDIEYQQVIEAHGRWYADGYDEAKCPEEIKAWADAEGVTPLQAAQEIAEAAAHREEVIRQIRSIRLAGKAAVRAAADDADFTVIAQPFIDQLNHIGEATIAAA